jgi:hypothetical protein
MKLGTLMLLFLLSISEKQIAAYGRESLSQAAARALPASKAIEVVVRRQRL